MTAAASGSGKEEEQGKQGEGYSFCGGDSSSETTGDGHGKSRDSSSKTGVENLSVERDYSRKERRRNNRWKLASECTWLLCQAVLSKRRKEGYHGTPD
uniref:Uncharacterized protein n=1 Tax=Peronospora matthiolae TaxID=2874970 RepID=A0AAV1V644_9STRA